LSVTVVTIQPDVTVRDVNHFTWIVLGVGQRLGTPMNANVSSNSNFSQNSYAYHKQSQYSHTKLIFSKSIFTYIQYIMDLIWQSMTGQGY